TNLPFLPVWLDWAGLGPREIAIITATPLFVRVAVTPAIAFAADRAGDHRRFLIGLSWAGLAALVVLAQSREFWAILACTAAFACRGRRPAGLAHLPDLPGGRRPGAGRACRVLYLRYAALARSRPLDGLVRRFVGDLDRRRGRAVCLLRRGGAAHRSGGADRA